MFEWDEDKRLLNLKKHHLDFIDARLFFDGRNTITAQSNYLNELRYLTIAIFDGKYHTVVWTWRDKKRRIISFRRSQNGEERAYRHIHG